MSRNRGRGGGRGSNHWNPEPRRPRPITITPYESKKDAEGHPMSVPLRFEVIKMDGDNKEVIKNLKEMYITEVKVAARECNVDIHHIGEIQATPVEGMKHERWVCHFKVSCKDFQKTLTLFAAEFYHRCKISRIIEPRSDEMPYLYAHSTNIFTLRLINTHENIPIRRLKFASLLNPGEIGVHWLVEGGVASEQDRDDGYRFYKDIDGSFEYDRRQITLFFQNKECHPEDPMSEIFFASYKLTINMSSIRKIGFDQSTFPNGEQRRSLILHVDYPPKIQVKLKDKDKEGNGSGSTRGNQSFNHNNRSRQQNGHGHNQHNEKTWGKYEHRLNICRGRYPEEVSGGKALHESKTIVLELDDEQLKENLAISDGSADSYALERIAFDILSRVRHRTEKPVEFTSYVQVDKIEGLCRRSQYDYDMDQIDPYDVEEFGKDVSDKIKAAASELVTRSKERTHFSLFEQRHHISLKAFRIRALLEGILQRGMDIRCQMLCDRNVWYSFVDMVCMRYKSDEQKTLAVMESLLSIISEGRAHCKVQNLFEKEWNDSRHSGHRTTVFTKEEERKGYTRLMKFVKTPTRLIFVGYETIMANRVLNKHSHNGTEIIRISFRDDSGEYMREASCGRRIIHNTMRAVLIDAGIKFGERTYKWLGNSNSQLRDHGCYMYHETDRKTSREIRRKLGNFHKLTNIPKWLARMGQCFTQAKASEEVLNKEEVGVTHDFVGGMTDKGKPYCFSDGVGTISYSLAHKLSNEHSLPRIASAFQIRHKGQKGLVCVDPIIDDRNELLRIMGRDNEKKMVYVRPSMDKFEVDETSREGPNETSRLEIVKYSMASPLFLNRPLLNILSQTTEDQSAESHAKMMNRVEELLDIQMRNVTHSLYREHPARETIKEMSFPFAMEVFSDSNPLRLTSEPFLRSLLSANARFVLHKQLAKMNIRIPSNFGRSMFGVVDPTGILQYGQIFVQYSTSTSKHMMKSRSKKREKRDGVDGAIILTGPCMMTKNPCIEKGDVRRFEAIDVPGLRYLVDVVVFPMHGPRPHPDEMAGSDLDGDEYSLIWDPQMLFDHNEEASLFPSGENIDNWQIVKKADGNVDHGQCERRLAEFYIEAVTQEQIGVLSNAHLATSDFFGLENKASRSLAKKISQSLDFQKNGIPPEPMTTQEEEDPDDPDAMIPPEKAVRKPDYMEKMRDAGYESRGIMGKVFREIKRYQHAIDWGDEQIEKIDIDPDFNLPGWGFYEDAVTREMETYCHRIRCLMEHYGIVSEGELMSGQIISIKNRISEKETDDMNLFNTNQIIEDKVKREIAAAREAFFATLIDWRTELDQVMDKRRDVDKDSILSYIARPNTPNMEKIRLKAAAAYNMCYQAANKQLTNGDQSIILSFPWVLYDVLSDIKRRPDVRIVRVQPEEKMEQNNEPLADVLSSIIDEYCEKEFNIDELNAFVSEFEEGSIIRRSLDQNEGLARASFVLVKWASFIGGMQEGAKFKQSHLVALFLRFGLGEVVVRGSRRRYIQRPSGEMRMHTKKGDHLLTFIDFLASREFRTMDSIQFGDILPGVLIRGEWKPFSELCIPAYLQLATTHRFSLPMDVDDDTEVVRESIIIKEFEPRKMELPVEIVGDRKKLDEVREALMRVSGCKDVQLRPMGQTTEVFVSALGSMDNFQRLTSFVVSPAPPRQEAGLKSADKGVARLVYERLMKAAN